MSLYLPELKIKCLTIIMFVIRRVIINYYAIVTYACITLKESKHRSSEYKLVTRYTKS